MQRIVSILTIVLLLVFTPSLMSQDLSYTQTPARYTTTPSQYTTTPSPYMPLADTVPPDFNEEEETDDDPYDEEDDSEEDTDDPSDLGDLNNVEQVVQGYAQYFLGLDTIDTDQFLTDFTNLAGQLGFQTGDVDLQTGVKIVLYLTLSRLLGLSSLGMV